MFKKEPLKNLAGLIGTLWVLIAFTPAQAQFKDPTKPDDSLFPALASTVKAPPEKLVLSAIWISTTGKWVTINGITAKKGQTILNNVKIVKITHNTVFLNHNGSTKILRLLHSPYETQ
jgi:hypothetical protein